MFIVILVLHDPLLLCHFSVAADVIWILYCLITRVNVTHETCPPQWKFLTVLRSRLTAQWLYSLPRSNCVLSDGQTSTMTAEVEVPSTPGKVAHENAAVEELPSPTKDTSADAALELLGSEDSVALDASPAEARRLVRKIDLYIMPLICVVYFNNYLDKIAVSYGSVTGLLKSAHLHGDQFNWVSSIFFFGQLAFEFPTIRLMQAFPLARYVAVNVVIWGGLLACLAACKSFASLMVCRALLGCAEAAIVPAWVVFTSQWSVLFFLGLSTEKCR